MQVVPKTLVSGSAASILPPSLPPSTLPPSTILFPFLSTWLVFLFLHIYFTFLVPPFLLPPLSFRPPSFHLPFLHISRPHLFHEPPQVRVFRRASGTLGNCNMTGGTWRAGRNAPALAGQETRASRLPPAEHDLGGDPRTPHTPYYYCQLLLLCVAAVLCCCTFELCTHSVSEKGIHS